MHAIQLHHNGMGDCRQTVATESRAKLRSISWNFSLASCICSVSVQFWPGPHIAQPCGRTDDLLKRGTHQRITRSQKAWDIRAFQPAQACGEPSGHFNVFGLKLLAMSVVFARRCGRSQVNVREDAGHRWLFYEVPQLTALH